MTAAARGGTPASLRPIAVTGALLLITLSMVIPIPAAVLDLGIALSIASSALILVMACLVQKPTDFQAFPVLLLVTLMVRLALNVSSTRLILTEGTPGRRPRATSSWGSRTSSPAGRWSWASRSSR